MADVKWIKIVTDMFNNRKIKQIRKMPEGDAIIVIWFQMLCLAGQTNDNGTVYFSKDVPYTDEMLATEFDRPISTIRLALAVFEKFGMIEIFDSIFLVSNWEKYQSVEKLDKIREQNRLRKQNQREREKVKLIECHVTSHTEVTDNHAIELELDKEKDIKECSEQICSKPTEPIFITLTLNNKSEHSINEKDLISWKELYPAVNIEQELRNMKGWLTSNPKKRKTKQGIQRFINSWLSREQDKGYSATTTKSKYKEL